jgi:hypothetical protein
MKTALIMTALTLCLMSTVSIAQTPAQDANTVAADEDAVADAKDTVQADETQLQADEVNNRDAIQADTDRLIADQQAHSSAREKLRNDKRMLSIDDKTFNGDGQSAKGMSGLN